MGSPTARGKRGKLLLWLELRRRRRRRKASGEGKRITVLTAKSSGYVKYWAKNSTLIISFHLDHNVMGEITSSSPFYR